VSPGSRRGDSDEAVRAFTSALLQRFSSGRACATGELVTGPAARGEIADADSASSVDQICRGSEDRATSTNGLLLLVDRLRSVHLCGARTQIRHDVVLLSMGREGLWWKDCHRLGAGRPCICAR
jgi:hypothetical protein